MPKSKKGKSQQAWSALPACPPPLSPLPSLFLDLNDTLGSNPTFLPVLNYYIRPEEMDAHVRAAAAIVGEQFTTAGNPFNVVQTKLGRASNLPPDCPFTIHLKSLLHEYAPKVKEAYVRRRTCARLCGVYQRRGNDDNGLPLGVKIEQIKRLPPDSLYPPPKHKILERPYLDDELNELRLCKTKAKDKSCTDTSLYHVLDNTKICYTVEQDQSVVLMDGDKIVTIVIRNFVMDNDCFKHIEEWCADLILASLECRRACLRNFPLIAHAGVTTGARSCLLFGWARNLLAKYIGTDDTAIQERELSSLFGFFYALLRGHCPAVAKLYEDTIAKSDGLPRLDKHNTSKFHLPCPDGPSFHGYPMSPPEGYIATNFSRPIHTDRHWEGCPLAVYWNIRRRQAARLTGKESGASFFIAEYGVRVINAENTSVIWDVSMNHGTGVYENGLEHVGVAMLMSKEIESSCEAYKAKVANSEIESGGLFWPHNC
jgi:hypothetical protein